MDASEVEAVRREQANRRRQQAYFKGRRQVATAIERGSALAVDRMSDPQLWLHLELAISDLVSDLSARADVDVLRRCLDAQACASEIRLRGLQLQLPA